MFQILRNRFFNVLLALTCVILLSTSVVAEARDLFVTNLNGNVNRISEDGSSELFADLDGWTHGVVFDTNGILYVASQQENSIFRFALDGTPLGAFVEDIPSPIGLTFDNSGHLYAVERFWGRVHRYDTNGTPLGVFAEVSNGFDIATDQNGNINVLSRSGKIFRYAPSGTLIEEINLPEGHGAEGLAFDSTNTLFIASQFDNDVLRYAGEGNWDLFASDLSAPVGLTFDEHDQLFVVESFGGNIKQYANDGTPLGTYSTGHGFALYATFAPIPEPSSLSLLCLGALGLLGFGRCRKCK